METYSLKSLLKLAERIQRRIKHEKNPEIANSLENDLKIVKAHIGNQILDMPEETRIFPKVKVTHYSAVNSPIRKYEFSAKPKPNLNKSFMAIPPDELSMKFDSFLEQRKKSKSPPKTKTPRKRSPSKKTKGRRR